jgi:hypothetical protein
MTDDILSQVVESYKQFLLVKYPTHYRRYCSRLKANLQGARAEAIVFSFLSGGMGSNLLLTVIV